MEPALQAVSGHVLARLLAGLAAERGCAFVACDGELLSWCAHGSPFAHYTRHDADVLAGRLIEAAGRYPSTRRDEDDVEVPVELPGLGPVVIIDAAGAHGHRWLMAVTAPRADRQPALVGEIRRVCELSLGNYLLRKRLAESGFESDYLGISREFHRVCEAIRRAAALPNEPVLITGERGSGKEFCARAIHCHSARRTGPFLPVNAAALHPDLYASELFGSRRGAYTGAVDERMGKFRAAHGGTIFFDEIGDVPPAVCAGLMRVLDSGEVQGLGFDKPLRVDVRVIAATNKDLGELARQGRFPADLLDRLNVLPVHVPPLQERREDIPLLVTYFLLKYCPRHGSTSFCRRCADTGQIACLGSTVLDLLGSYDWPGNVRELRNIAIRLISAFEGAEISPQALPADVRHARRTDSPRDLNLEGAVRAHIVRALVLAGGNKSATARLLHIPLSTLVSKMKRLKIASDAGARAAPSAAGITAAEASRSDPPAPPGGPGRSTRRR